MLPGPFIKVCISQIFVFAAKRFVKQDIKPLKDQMIKFAKYFIL